MTMTMTMTATTTDRTPPGTRVSRRAGAGARAASNAGLESLKNRLLRLHLAETVQAEHAPRIRRATEDAASLAWATPFPLLVLPELVEERVAVERSRAELQDRIRQRSRHLLMRAE